MKKILVFCAMALSLGFVSCGSDDDSISNSSIKVLVMEFTMSMATSSWTSVCPAVCFGLRQTLALRRLPMMVVILHGVRLI